MTRYTAAAAIALVLTTASCGSDPRGPQGLPTAPMPLPEYLMRSSQPVPMDPSRKVSEQDCSTAVDTAGGGNLRCK